MTDPILSVTVQATDRTLLSIAELRAAVGQKDGARDADLLRLAGRVYDRITQACRISSDGAKPPTLRRESLTDTFRFDACRNGWRDTAYSDGRDKLTLSRRPIVSIAQVIEDGTVLVQDTDFVVLAGAGMLQRISALGSPTFWRRAGTTVVSYDAGFDTVPEGLKRAAEELLRRDWSAQSRDPNLREVNVPGVLQRSYWVGAASDPDIPQDVLDMLGPYINMVI